MSDTGLPSDAPAGTNGPEETTDTPSVTSEQSQGSSDNPAWKPLLDALPTSLHGMARPHLQEWDRNVQQLVQKVQSPYQPYKSLIDEGVSMDEITQARNLMRMIASDPRTFYDRMTQHYADEWGLNQGSDQGQVEDEWEEDDSDNPLAAQLREAHEQIAAMQSNQETMANYLAGQHQTQLDAQANAQVEQEFDQAKAKYGDISPKQVGIIAAIAIQNGVTVPEAADIYFDGQPQQAAQPKAPAVRVMPTTGGVPAAPPVNPAKLSGQDRRALITNILAQNANNNT